MKLSALKDFFNSVEQWPESIRFDACSTTNEVQKTVESHIMMIENNLGKEKFEPYYDRLMQVYNKLNS